MAMKHTQRTALSVQLQTLSLNFSLNALFTMFLILSFVCLAFFV